ncbi:hypothetical protein V8F06_008533, partial [Rhypophila decipiens]
CGIVPNDDTSLVPFLYTFVVLASVLVSLRFLARMQKRASIWWDDWSILAAVLVIIVWTSVCLLFRQYGAGRDIWSLTPEDVDQLLKLFYISTFFYLVSRCLIRISIICFLLRLFSVAGIIAMIFDIFIMLLPLVWIVNLQFSFAKKLCDNNRVIAVSVMRILVLRKFLTEPNISANFPSVTIWGGLDIHVSLICACLPSLRPLSSWFIGKVVPASFRSKNSKGGSSANPPTIGSGGKRRVLRTIGGSTYPDTESAQDIKMTTTIQQRNNDSRSGSQTQLSLHSLELYDRQNGNVRGEAWA